MATKKALVLGGGISGLTAAYELSKKYDVILIEKDERVGGWIETRREHGYLFEKGPRTFPASRSRPLLEIAKELQIEDAVIPSSPHAKKRYLWHMGKLRPIPGNPNSPIMRPLLLAALFKEWRVPKYEGDETVWEFAARRFGPKVADLLFDPITMGVYGGDAKSLSVSATFPIFKSLEREYGSLIKGMWRLRKRKPDPLPISSLPRRALFSFKEGTQSLVNALEQKMAGRVLLGEAVCNLHHSTQGWTVQTDKGEYFADCIVSAMPAQQLGQLLSPLNREMSQLLTSIPYQDLTLVSMGFERSVIKYPGFGYLVPSLEQERIGGMIFDSSLFPEHSHRVLETRLTAILRGLPHDAEQIALESIQRHLEICQTPDLVKVFRAPKAIPQYLLGHQAKIQELKSLQAKHLPTAFFTGSYVSGVSVSDCIADAQSCAKSV